MEQYIEQAVGFLSSADIYLVAIGAIIAALIPILKKTKSKKDEVYAEKALTILNKIRNLFKKKEAEPKKEDK